MMNEWILSSSILIAAVLAVRFVLRGKISLRLQYALWAVVLVRLLLPVHLFTSDFGTGAVAQDVDISSPVRRVYIAARSADFEADHEAAYQQIEAEYTAQNRVIAPDAIDKEAYTRVRQQQELELNRFLRSLWLCGMTMMIAVIVCCNAHMGMRLRRTRSILDVPDSLLPVYVTDSVPTPCIFGIFRPAIYLPFGAAQNAQIRSHVLAHELTHYRHFDHIWSVLRSVCLVLHWYNPLVWIAAKVSRSDAELACDEGALVSLGEEQRADYGKTLIGLTCSTPISDLLLTATTMTSSAGFIRERIRLLMQRPRNTALTVTAAVLLVTISAGCSFAGAPVTTQPGIDQEGIKEELEYDNMTSTDHTYALPMEQAIEEYAEKNPRELGKEELNAFRAAFGTLLEDGSANPAACFLLPYYDDISNMDGSEFLAYFPTDQEGSREEFELLKAKYPDFFAEWTYETMPVPIHRYDADTIDDVVFRYANIHWPELDEGVHFLEETGCYYNYTSDFGLGGFYARGGFVYDGGAVIYSDFSALFLTETAGHYSIRAHLPALIPE